MAVYEASKRVKSPAPRAIQQMTTARKKVQAANVKYEPARRDKEATRNNRKVIKGHTLNISKMPDAVQVNLVDDVSDAPANSLK